MKIKVVLLLMVIAAALIVRLYNFENRFGFGPEQALSLLRSAEMVHEKFSLLGIEYVQRITSDGHMLFTGPLFSYSLIPLLLIFQYSPVYISAFFAVLNVVTGVLVYLLGRRMVGERPAVIAMVLFLFNSVMVNHSMFIWIPNYMPMVGIVTLYLLFYIKKKYSLKTIFLLGLVTGIGVSLQYVYIPFAIVIGCLLAFISWKQKVTALFVYGIAVVLANFPTILFDLKHEFYNLRTLVQYVSETIANPGQSEFALYHLLVLWPLVFLFLGVVLSKLVSKNKIWLLLIPVYIYLNLSSSVVSFGRPVGKEDGLSWPEIYQASSTISQHTDGNFNVATLTDFNFRSFVLRYTLTYIFNEGDSLLGEEDYDITDKVYIIAPTQYDFATSGVYEVTALSPFTIEKLSPTGEYHSLFLVSRQHN